MPLTFAHLACCDAFILAMVLAERLPVLPSLLAEVDLVVAGACDDPLNSAAISAWSAAICSEMARPRWSCWRVGVLDMDEELADYGFTSIIS